MSKHTMNSRQTVIGLDIGDRHCHFCVLDPDHAEPQHGRVATQPEKLQAFFAKLPGALVVMEAGTHSPWIQRLVRECGGHPLVANPRQVRLIYAGRRKSDRLDAEALARLGRADTELLYPIRPCSKKTQANRAILRSRRALIDSRTALITSVRGQVKAWGERLPSSSSEAFVRKARPALPTVLAPALAPILDVIESLNDKIKTLDERIAALAEDTYPVVQLLQQIPGVGPIASLAYVLTIEDPFRFAKSRDVPAYLGLVPRRAQSGDRDPRLGITKAGDPYLRALLTQCAQYVLGPFGPDTALRRWGLGLVARGGAGAKKKAVTAVARKLAVLMHRLWVTQGTYQSEGRIVA